MRNSKVTCCLSWWRYKKRELADSFPRGLRSLGIAVRETAAEFDKAYGKGGPILLEQIATAAMAARDKLRAEQRAEPAPTSVH
jgi:hypothetical protein